MFPPASNHQCPALADIVNILVLDYALGADSGPSSKQREDSHLYASTNTGIRAQ